MKTESHISSPSGEAGRGAKAFEIAVRRLRVYAHHGCGAQERVVGADFYVSIEARAEAEASAWRDDRLEGTVDYSLFVGIARREMAVASNLLEHVCSRIGQAVLSECPQVQQVTVTIEKENPPFGVSLDGVTVKATFSRGDGSTLRGSI